MLKKSFTLIELLVYLSLLLLIIAITIPRFSFFDKHLLTHELDKLFATFTYLQQKSIASNKRITLTLDQNSNSYSYLSQNSNVTTEQLSDQIIFGFIDGAMGPPGNPSQKIRFPINLEHPLNNSDRQDNPTVIFKPNGRISPCTLYLRDKTNKNMGALTCSVSQVSYIRRYLYDNFKWKNLEN